MIDTYFDIAFEEFYTRWVLKKIISTKDSSAFFVKINNKVSVNDFLLFLMKMKEKQEYKDEFNTLYSKEYMKSFFSYLYTKTIEIEKNKLELLSGNILSENINLVKKYYDLVWSISFLQKIVNEYFLDIQEYKVEMKKSVDLLFSKGDNKKKLNSDFFREIDSIEKIDFVVNGKYTNEELYNMLFRKQVYSTYLPNTVFSLLLDETDFINLYNYPLKDYMLFLEFLKEMSFIEGKKHLIEYYKNNGSIKIRNKYKEQYDSLLKKILDIRLQYFADNSDFVFHKIPINYNETSDKYFGIPYYITESNIYGVGAILLNRDSIYNPLLSIFEDVENELSEKIRKKENQGLREQILKNPKFFKEFLFMNKVKEGASSLEAVLNKDEYLKDSTWEKRSKIYEKEVDSLFQNILNEK